jgi:hypothetical protein
VVFVSEDNSQELLSEYERSSTSIFEEFNSYKITETIQKYESNMFVKLSKCSA